MERTDIRVRRRRRVALGLTVLTAFLGGLWLAQASWQDDADRAYRAFLRSDEQALTDAQRRAHIDRAIELQPRAAYFEARAIFAFDRGEYADSLSDLQRAIAGADRPYLHYLRGLTLSRMGAFRRALPEYDHAIRVQPWNTQFYRGRAMSRLQLGDSAGALADGERMVHDAPHWGESYFVRAAALEASGRMGAALRDFDEAMTRSTHSYIARARANCRERLGDAEGAASDRARPQHGATDAFHY